LPDNLLPVFQQPGKEGIEMEILPKAKNTGSKRSFYKTDCFELSKRYSTDSNEIQTRMLQNKNSAIPA
jgi:hypothetical protein